MPRRLVLPLVLAALVAACGDSSSSSQSARGPGATPESAPTEQAPEPLSADEYRKLVREQGRQVSKAFASVRGARNPEGLQSRLEGGAEDLEAAADALEAAVPPAESAEAHGQAVEQLSALAARFASTATREDGKACTSPAAMAQLTRSEEAASLRRTARDLGVPKATKTPRVRLKNGVLFRAGGSGRGQLTIQNNYDTDRVLKVRSSNGRLSIYVRAQGNAKVEGITDGKYTVYVASGSSWDGKRNTFSRDCAFAKLGGKMTYTTPPGQFTTYTLTLNTSIGTGEGVESQPIDPKDFPRD